MNEETELADEIASHRTATVPFVDSVSDFSERRVIRVPFFSAETESIKGTDAVGSGSVLLAGQMSDNGEAAVSKSRLFTRLNCCVFRRLRCTGTGEPMREVSNILFFAKVHWLMQFTQESRAVTR